MILVEDDSGGEFLLQTESLTDFVPKLMAVCLDKRCLDAVHDDTAVLR